MKPCLGSLLILAHWVTVMLLFLSVVAFSPDQPLWKSQSVHNQVFHGACLHGLLFNTAGGRGLGRHTTAGASLLTCGDVKRRPGPLRIITVM